MKFIEQLYKLDRLDALIRRKATGNPKELARKFEVSERTIFNLLESLKYLGAEIKYCRFRETYFYKKELPVRLDSLLDPPQQNQTKGGMGLPMKKVGSLQFFCRI